MRFILLLLSISLVAVVEPAQAQRRAAVVVDAVQTTRVSDTRPVIGRLVPSIRSQIASRTAGIVEAVLFQVGDRVKQGQVLVRIDTEVAEIERNSAIAAKKAAEAGVAVAEAKLQLARQAFERQSQLRQSMAFSRSRFEDLRQSMEQARSELQQARANIGTALAQIARAEHTLKHARIIAPFDGIVVSRMAQPGQYLQLGTAVATLLDTNALEIDADVPTSLVSALKPGQEVTAHFDGQTDAVIANVRVVIPVDNLSTRTRSVRFSVNLGKLDAAVMAVGTAVTLSIPTSAAKSVLTVAKDALVQAGNGWMVFVAKSGKADPRPIALGLPVGDRIEVTSGLSAGELVVVRGNERLRPGQPLLPRKLGKHGTAQAKKTDDT